LLAALGVLMVAGLAACAPLAGSESSAGYAPSGHSRPPAQARAESLAKAHHPSTSKAQTVAQRQSAAAARLKRAAEELAQAKFDAIADIKTSVSYGDSGAAVVTLQQRLTALGYWVDTESGSFDDSTEQAVWALQKAAGLHPDGVVGPHTWKALAEGALPEPRTRSGYVIEVDLADDILMVVDNGRLQHILNVSTGGGYLYSTGGGTYVADTPTGIFHIYTAIDGLVTDSLGQLWRPRYFYSGFAIHGEGYVPPFPVSHGCVRVSDAAIDWIWADNVAPIGTEVDVYS
jgi:peptidoglycan hydrolase-like protein with peptidoglycan-binding domain